MLSRHECYEVCVQSPGEVVALLQSVHGSRAVWLREDFCGTAAVSREWVRRGGWAVGVDVDTEVLGVARERAGAGLGGAEHGRLVLVEADCRGGRVNEAASLIHPLKASGAGRLNGHADGFDVVFVGNYSIGYLHTRAELVGYLRGVLLSLGAGGVVVCDTYGGATAFVVGGSMKKVAGPGGCVVHRTWEHEWCDPLTGMVRNVLSFRLEVGGEVVREWPRAFEYVWRLWSIAELREAMVEAGFAGTGVYDGLDEGGVVREVEAGGLGADWVVLVVGRKAGVSRRV